MVGFALNFIPLLLFSTASEAISGGNPAQYGFLNVPKLEYQVSILHSGNRNYPCCGGAVISSRWVITTASCVKTTVRDIIERVLHPDYNSQSGYANIGLIKVSTDFYFEGHYTKPVALTNINSTTPGQLGIVSGFGSIYPLYYVEQPDSYKLMYAKIEVIEHSKCKATLKGYYNLNDDQFCAGRIGAGISACDRDLGGPMVIQGPGSDHPNTRGKLIGLVAHTFCALNGFPTPFTNVGYYREWIRSVTGV
ncbi:trypsin-5-like [Neocloeon triangulifer]|uniref:trypsin-5-like n=1 Tax=Neocloeon triangulifer TaxID=2078957 RepID=UPI00286F647B|nr:trypsin-5-like [Neocloeon triangulifer]